MHRTRAESHRPYTRRSVSADGPHDGALDGSTLPLGWRAPGKAPIGFAPPAVDRGSGRDELIAADDEQHILCVSRTGGGKGVGVVIPMLLSDYAGTIVVVDPKGEAAAVTARHQRALGKRVYTVDAFNVLPSLAGGITWSVDTLNPMQRFLLSGAEAHFDDDCLSMAFDLAAEQRINTRESFWPLGGAKLLAATIGYAASRHRFDAGASRHGTLADVYRFLHADDVRYATARILDTVGKHPAFPTLVYEYFVGFLSYEADKVAPSILSEAQLMCSLFGSSRVQGATSASTIDLEAFGRGEPMVIYLVLPPDRLASHAALLRLWLGQLIAMATRRTCMPAIPTLFLVDEAAHLGPMPQLKDCVTLLRGYGVRVALFVQALAQLKGMFGDEWQTVVENCGTLLTFSHASVASARQVAEQLGDISGEALFALDASALAIHCAGEPTVLARRLDYRADAIFAGRFDVNPYYASRPRRDAKTQR